MIRSSLFVLSTTALALVVASACNGPEATQPPPNVATATPPPLPSPNVPPTVTPPGPSTHPSPFPLPNNGGNTGGGTAQALDPNVAAAATGALALYASTEAPGMAKDGAPIAGNFQEGQTLEAPFTFQPGKCYTLVGAGAGVTQLELEMQYTTPVPGLSPSVGKSAASGALASIGGKGSCLKPLSPIAAPAKLIVRAVKGTGLAAAQLYSK